jgi:hypothetical protein
VPEQYRWLLHVNPMTPIIKRRPRGALDGELPRWQDMAIACPVAIAALLAGIAVFPPPGGELRGRAVTPVLRFDAVWKGYTDGPVPSAACRGIVARRVPALRRGAQLALGAARHLAQPSGRHQPRAHRPQRRGKSTFLRLASRLGRPTRGRIEVAEDAATVLNLGTSFDPQLSGRDTPTPRRGVGGLSSRAAGDAAFAAVRSSSPSSRLREAPLWTYSDGMRLRLAFGVVAQLHPGAPRPRRGHGRRRPRLREKCARRIDELRAGRRERRPGLAPFEEIARVCDQANLAAPRLVRAQATWRP